MFIHVLTGHVKQYVNFILQNSFFEQFSINEVIHEKKPNMLHSIKKKVHFLIIQTLFKLPIIHRLKLPQAFVTKPIIALFLLFHIQKELNTYNSMSYF